MGYSLSSYSEDNKDKQLFLFDYTSLSYPYFKMCLYPPPYLHPLYF